MNTRLIAPPETTTRMHRCLQIPEIILVIVNSLSCKPSGNWNEFWKRRRAYAALARTCRSFYAPAVDALWSNIPNLDPLIKCLPPHTWELRDKSIPIMVHSPQGEEWERFLLYASRVKHLTLHKRRGAGSDDILLEQLRMLQASQPSPTSPFTNLRSLRLDSLSTPSALHVSLLFGTKLVDVRMADDTSNGVRGSLLASLAHMCPDINRLDLRGLAGDASTTITLFQKLQTVDVSPPRSGRDSDDSGISPMAISHLAMLPTLLSLSVAVPDPANLNGLDTSVTFSTLRSLNLTAIVNPQHLVSFLQVIASVNLRELHLSFSSMCAFPSPQTMDHIIDTITRFPNLQVLELSSGHEDQNGAYYDFHPLFRIQSLQRVQLDMSGAYTVDNQLIPAIGKSWPDLRELCVQSLKPTLRDNSESSPQLTLVALGLFAVHCPKLVQLEIALDATVLLHEDTPSPRSLEPIRIRLEESLINEDCWMDVAAYISGVYPNGSVVNHQLEIYGCDPDDSHRFWLDVGQWIPTLTKIRRDELARVGAVLK